MRALRSLRSLFLLPLFLLLSCQRAPAPHDGPIVLVTFDSLRADVVGGLGGQPGLMPNLEALAREANWAGRGISASSWGVPAMASIFTGLQPWQHQVLHAGSAHLSPDLLTLPEALAAQGYETAGYFTGHWYSSKFGYSQGFVALQPLSRGRRAAEHLSVLNGKRQFVWVHIPEPQAPYLRRDEFLKRLGPGAPARLPPRITLGQLEPFFDPATPLPPGRRRRFWAMYRLNAAWADERLGKLIEALRASGQWDRTLLVVTANHGEELGEKGQILAGGNLGRQLLEVPLVVKLPAGFERPIRVPRDERPGIVRLWATLVEAAGGSTPPAVAPSLFREAPPGVLSELYLTNGTNQFSWVEGDSQLFLESRFAPAERDYYRARQAAGRPRLASRLPEPPGALFDRLGGAFRATPPLSGTGEPRVWLERWNGAGSTPASDSRRAAEMARRLREAWDRTCPEEHTPGGEAREWEPSGAGDILASRPDKGPAPGP